MNQVIEKIKNTKKVRVQIITQLGSLFPTFSHRTKDLDGFLSLKIPMGNWSFFPFNPHRSFLKIRNYTLIVLTCSYTIRGSVRSKKIGLTWFIVLWENNGKSSV